MYVPPHFSETRPEVLHALIRQFPLATLLSGTGATIECSHVPLFLDAEKQVLRGHLARANSHWQTLDGAEALAIFHGPSHYVTPSWYPSKQENGKVVPTWNYVVAHVRGRVQIVEDGEFLLHNVAELTSQQELERDDPWAVSDAPSDYIHGLTRAIVGLRLEISSIEGKWKLSQNRPLADRAGVRDGLAKLGTGGSLAMLDAMNDYSPKS
jgi:transcriptional regulator